MVLLAVIVSVDVPDPVMLVVDNEGVKPALAESVRATVPANPFIGATVMVEV